MHITQEDSSHALYGRLLMSSLEFGHFVPRIDDSSATPLKQGCSFDSPMKDYAGAKPALAKLSLMRLRRRMGDNFTLALTENLVTL